MKVLAAYSIKGGVGKTAAAVNLAFEAAAAGARVLVWDLDPQGAATYYFRIKPKVKGGAERLLGSKGELGAYIRPTDVERLDLIPADFSLRHLDLFLDDSKRPTKRLATLLATVGAGYDVALLDCPPSISLASESVFGAADALLVPVIPTTLSSRTLSQLDQFLADHSAPPAVLPYFSMVDRRKRLHQDMIASLPRQFPTFLTTVIPNASTVERMGPQRAPVGAFAPTTPAAQAYRALWVEVAARLA